MSFFKVFLICLLFSNLAHGNFKFKYSNDFFTGSDRYFSQGIFLEYTHKGLKKILPSRPLFVKKEKILHTSYSLGIDYLGFTPKNSDPPFIQLGDRPFANVMLFIGSTDSLLKKHDIRITSKIKIGAIGPITGGEFVHKTIHKATGNDLPRGWDNQIRNDLALSYHSTVRKYFSFLNNLLEFQGLASVELGSFKIRQQLGIELKLGRYPTFEKINQESKQSSLYFYLTPSLSRIYFDSTMEGGLFNKNSPYKLSSKEVEDYVGKIDYGVHFSIKSFSIEYEQTWISKEFNLGQKHTYGSLSLLFNF